MPRRSAIIIGLIALSYAAVRLWRLADSCLWFDEIFSVHAAEHQWSEIIPFVAKDLIHPPLFYMLLKIWIAVGGEGLVWLRLFPVAFSTLALIPMWMLCRELKLRFATIAVALSLFAVNGALIKYAQEVRMYSLLLFLSLVSIWLFSRFFFRGKSFWVLVLTNVLLVYCHYFGWLVVASEVAAIAFAQRIKILQTLLMFGVVAAAFVPWVFALFRFAEPESSVTQNIGWMQRPGFRSVLDFALDLFDPFYFQQSSAERTANFAVAIPLAAVVFAAAIFCSVRLKNDTARERTLFLLFVSVVPVLLALVFSWLLPVSIWGSRHLIIVFPPAIILTALFLTDERLGKLKHALVAGAAVFVVIAFAMFARTERGEYIWCAWEALGRELPASSPRTVYVFEDLAAYHVWFSNRTDETMRVVKVENVPGVVEDKAYFLPRGFDAVKRVGSDEIQDAHFWIMFRDREWNRNHPPLSSFGDRGYSVQRAGAIETDHGTAFLAEVTK